MTRTFTLNDEGMIKDDQGRWIPPIADNKDYIEAIIGQNKGEIAIVPAVVPVRERSPEITADLIKTLITDLKKVVSVDPSLDQFVTAAIAVDANVDSEKP